MATDDRVEFELRLTDEELLVLMKAAHERDLTFNQFAEEVIIEYCQKVAAERGIEIPDFER